MCFQERMVSNRFLDEARQGSTIIVKHVHAIMIFFGF